MAAYTTIDNPELYFQVKLYTGNETDNTAYTFDGDEDMQPDLLWFKERSSTSDHALWDSVRGTNKKLEPSTTQADSTEDVITFDSDGFSVDDHSQINQDTITMVCWAWKAGSAFSNDASATSIGDIDSSGSASTTAGFSICSYTGSGSAGDEIKHGLDKTPEMLIFKNRSTVVTWIVGSKPAGFTNIQFLQDDDAATDDSNAFNDTDPTSSVFTLGGNAGTGTNETDSSFICYAFTSIQGYSKIGSYTGNGSTDGTFVYTGFRPAYILFKKTSDVSEWSIFDNKRNTFNVVDNHLYADLSNAEGADDDLDFLSNGFKFIRAGGNTNASGSTYIYMAFAEAPFVNSNGVPCNAR